MATAEPLADIGELFNNHGDGIILRHNQNDSVHEMRDSLPITIDNAGNGIHEHLTQAMADLYTIFKWRPKHLNASMAGSEGIRIGFIGVPGRMHTVRSLSLQESKFASATPRATGVA